MILSLTHPHCYAFMYPMNESVDKNISVRDTKYGKVEAVINDILRG